ncbi:hypothetical protein L6452_02690 [Arctium lappa]|uniref:Uncharacterized protein n=1 Tax=Arctium lappa TaxID=4217 RepID=A0ACB9FK50_ARCLA|nr:hypothetical protein L6452_02690 [Arctium lappa]
MQPVTTIPMQAVAKTITPMQVIPINPMQSASINSMQPIANVSNPMQAVTINPMQAVTINPMQAVANFPTSIQSVAKVDLETHVPSKPHLGSSDITSTPPSRKRISIKDKVRKSNDKKMKAELVGEPRIENQTNGHTTHTEEATLQSNVPEAGLSMQARLHK